MRSPVLVGVGVRVWPYLGNGKGDNVSLGMGLCGTGSVAFKVNLLKDQGYSGFSGFSGFFSDWGEEFVDLRNIHPSISNRVQKGRVQQHPNLRIEIGFSEG